MLREIELTKVMFGMYVRVIIRQLNRKSMSAVMKTLKNLKKLKYEKEIKYIEKIDGSTLLIIYKTVDCYRYGRFQDFINILREIHKAIICSTDKDYLIDFITTNKGFYNFSLVGSKHYIEGKLSNDYYIVDDSIMTNKTFFNRDAYEALLKYKYLSNFLLTF